MFASLRPIQDIRWLLPPSTLPSPEKLPHRISALARWPLSAYIGVAHGGWPQLLDGLALGLTPLSPLSWSPLLCFASLGFPLLCSLRYGYGYGYGLALFIVRFIDKGHPALRISISRGIAHCCPARCSSSRCCRFSFQLLSLHHYPRMFSLFFHLAQLLVCSNAVNGRRHVYNASRESFSISIQQPVGWLDACLPACLTGWVGGWLFGLLGGGVVGWLGVRVAGLVTPYISGGCSAVVAFSAPFWSNSWELAQVSLIWWNARNRAHFHFHGPLLTTPPARMCQHLIKSAAKLISAHSPTLPPPPPPARSLLCVCVWNCRSTRLSYLSAKRRPLCIARSRGELIKAAQSPADHSSTTYTTTPHHSTAQHTPHHRTPPPQPRLSRCPPFWCLTIFLLSGLWTFDSFLFSLFLARAELR